MGCERAYGGLNQGCPGEGKLIHYLARSRVEFNDSTGTKAARKSCLFSKLCLNLFSIPLRHFLFKHVFSYTTRTCVHVPTSFSGHLWHHRHPGSRILHLCEDDGDARLRKRLTEDAQEAVM